MVGASVADHDRRMTTPSIDPRLVHVLTGEVAALQQHLGRVGHDLGILAQQLATVQAPAPQPVVHRPAPAPMRPQPQAQAQARFQPPPTVPWWQRDGVVSRLLAAAGAGVTVIGVVMLVVLAAQSGWFGPGARVAAGATLSAVLIAAAHRIVARPGGTVGAVALAATGFAGLYLDIAAVTALYGWVHPVVGLVTGLAVASLGIGVATRWSSQPLAVMVLVGVAVLAPVATAGITSALLAFLVILQIAASPVDSRLDWVWLRVARTVPVVGAILLAVLTASIGGARGSELAPLLVVAAVSFAAAVAAWYSTLTRRPVDPVSVAAVVATAGSTLATATLFSRPVAGITCAAVAMVLLAVTATTRGLASPVRFVFAVTGAVAGISAVLVGTPRSIHAVTLLTVAVAALVTGGWTRSRVTAGVGAFVALAGLVAHTQVTSVDALTYPGTAAASGWASIPGSVAALAMAVAGVWASVRTLDDATARTVSASSFGIAGLYAITATSVVAGVEIGSDTGFFVGHGIATISWMIVAVVALVRGLADRRDGHTLLVIGLAVVAAAVAKLFLFDLGALGGLPRAAAFLVVGMLLLGIGTRYARAFADRAGTDVTDGAGEPAAR